LGISPGQGALCVKPCRRTNKANAIGDRLDAGSTLHQSRAFQELFVGLENGKRSVSASNLLDIARTLNVSLDYLMTGKASGEQQAEVSISSSLAIFAADAGLSLRQTLMLLDMQKQIVAHRSAKKKDGLEAVDWQKFYEGVKEFLEDE